MRDDFLPADVEAYRAFIEELPAKTILKSDTDALVQCPDPGGRHANGDEDPSLGVDLRRNGRGPKIVFKCQAQGCDASEILEAWGMTWSEVPVRLLDERAPQAQGGGASRAGVHRDPVRHLQEPARGLFAACDRGP